MELRYSTRSRFFAPIEEALSSPEFEKGSVLVDLGPRGYERDVTVRIHAHELYVFETDWAGSNPSRFSARIRAAATVLKRRGMAGQFRISHRRGVLHLQRL
jgi:hypothetical protein